MKFSNILLIVCFFSASTFGQDYPKFEDLMTHLSETSDGCLNSEKFNIIKHPKGYFLNVQDEVDYTKDRKYRIWSSETAKYDDPKYFDDIRKDQESKEHEDDLIKGFSPNGFNGLLGSSLLYGRSYNWYEGDYGYNRNGYRSGSWEFTNKVSNERDEYNTYLYYGYGGWRDDVIDLLGSNISNLSDRELESLAAAYGSKCNELLHGWDTDQRDYVHFWSYRNQNPDSARMYKELCTKALDCYSQLKSQNPNYVLKDGQNINVVLSDKAGVYWEHLSYMGMPKEAEAFLSKVKYPESMISSLKEYLDSKPANAMFIVEDSETSHRLEWLQKAHDFRTDITIINGRWITTPWYIEMLQDKKGLTCHLDPNVYRHKDYWYANVIGTEFTSPEPYDVDSILEALVTLGNPDSNQIELTKSIRISYLGDSLPISMNSQYGAYFPRRDAIVLDIIHNNSTRPVLLSGCCKLNSLGLEHYIKSHLRSFELCSETQSYKYENMIYDNSTVDKMLSYFKKIKTSSVDQTSNTYLGFLQSYIELFDQIGMDDSIRGVKLRKEYVSKFPSKGFGDNLDALYWEMGLIDKRDTVGRKAYFENLLDKIDEYVSNQLPLNDEAIQLKNCGTLNSILSRMLDFEMELKNEDRLNLYLEFLREKGKSRRNVISIGDDWRGLYNRVKFMIEGEEKRNYNRDYQYNGLYYDY